MSYDTASSLQHALLAAYVQLQKEKPELYAEVTEQIRPFFDHLSAYVEKHS